MNDITESAQSIFYLFYLSLTKISILVVEVFPHFCAPQKNCQFPLNLLGVKIPLKCIYIVVKPTITAQTRGVILGIKALKALHNLIMVEKTQGYTIPLQTRGN